MGFNSITPMLTSEQVSLTTTVAQFTLGSRVIYDGNEYVYVYNGAANSKITTGQPAVMDIAQSLSSGYTVTVTNAASQAGVFAGVAQQTFNTGTYGWIMTRGLSLVALDAGQVSFNVNVRLALAVDGGFAAAPATMSTSPHYGISLNSIVTTVGTGKARIWGGCL